MVKRLFRRKILLHILEEINIEKHRLHRTLNAFDLTILGIGAIIGVGIFVLTGTASARYAGPGIIFSFVISGLACAQTFKIRLRKRGRKKGTDYFSTAIQAHEKQKRKINLSF